MSHSLLDSRVRVAEDRLLLLSQDQERTAGRVHWLEQFVAYLRGVFGVLLEPFLIASMPSGLPVLGVHELSASEACDRLENTFRHLSCDMVAPISFPWERNKAMPAIFSGKRGRARYSQHQGA